MAAPLDRCGLQTSRSHIGAVLLHRNPYQWYYLPAACYLYTPSMTAHSAGVWLCVQVPKPASVDHQAARSRLVTQPFLENFCMPEKIIEHPPVATRIDARTATPKHSATALQHAAE